MALHLDVKEGTCREGRGDLDDVDWTITDTRCAMIREFEVSGVLLLA